MNFKIRQGRVEDCEATLQLIKELAVYEKAPEEVEIDVQTLQEDGFGENPIYNLLVAEKEGRIIGLALYYEKYSTWKGRCTYLEDLIVTHSERGIGAGKALFEGVIKAAKERNSGRMEWQVLDWNAPSIEFYKKYGAELDGEWFNGRFRREQLEKLDV